ncbi:MAG: Fic family protein [Planctomycetes bacterium]|nr:Fic family protein [Planctomycetota bacterium]
MRTLRKFAVKLETVPATVSWYLADLGEARGRQELFTRQSPQRLKVLREHALIESAVSSNRIEGVTVEPSRVGTIVFGRPLLRDRNEEEVRGYREALRLVHEQGDKLPVSEETILKLHRLARGEIWDAGKYKEKDGDIIEKFPDGRERIRFKTVPARETPAFMRELIELWNQCLAERWAHPLIALAAFNLDFLCIHPFRDGNGRASRLLLLLQCHHLGYEVGRYISLERLIEQNKERYYETLDQSSRLWHEGRHDPWPYIGYLLYLLKMAYREFEDRLSQTQSPRGEKTALVVRAIHLAPAVFRIGDIQKGCPGVSMDMIRKVLKTLRSEGRLECLGRGQNAHWRKTQQWQMGNTH